MQTNSQYKNLAVEALTGNWSKGAIVTLIYLLIFGGVSSILPIALGGSGDNLNAGDGSSLISILLLPIQWGLIVFFLSIYRHENPDYGELFAGFHNYLKILGTLLLQTVYTVLWTCLLIIPGIVKGYSYSMTSYIMRDDPALKYDSAITASSRMMQGHKMQLFLLDLSMIGWAILSCLTFGIGFLFLIPYNQTAHAAFYEDLKAEQTDLVEVQ